MPLLTDVLNNKVAEISQYTNLDEAEIIAVFRAACELGKIDCLAPVINLHSAALLQSRQRKQDNTKYLVSDLKRIIDQKIGNQSLLEHMALDANLSPALLDLVVWTLLLNSAEVSEQLLPAVIKKNRPVEVFTRILKLKKAKLKADDNSVQYAVLQNSPTALQEIFEQKNPPISPNESVTVINGKYPALDFAVKKYIQAIGYYEKKALKTKEKNQQELAKLDATIEVVRILVTNGATLSWPLLKEVFDTRRNLITSVLLQANFNFNHACENGLTPLEYALNIQLPSETLTLLIKKGAKTIFESNGKRKRLLLDTIKNKFAEGVDAILTNDLNNNVDAPDEEQNLPIVYAVRNKDVPTIKVLLKHRATQNTTDKQNGKTILVLALEAKSEESEKIVGLLADNETTNVCDDNKDSPLILAVRNRVSSPIIKLLIDKGADIFYKNPKTELDVFDECFVTQPPQFETAIELLKIAVGKINLMAENKRPERLAYLLSKFEKHITDKNWYLFVNAIILLSVNPAEQDLKDFFSWVKNINSSDCIEKIEGLQKLAGYNRFWIKRFGNSKAYEYRSDKNLLLRATLHVIAPLEVAEQKNVNSPQPQAPAQQNETYQMCLEVITALRSASFDGFKVIDLLIFLKQSATEKSSAEQFLSKLSKHPDCLIQVKAANALGQTPEQSDLNMKAAAVIAALDQKDPDYFFIIDHLVFLKDSGSKQAELELQKLRAIKDVLVSAKLDSVENKQNQYSSLIKELKDEVVLLLSVDELFGLFRQGCPQAEKELHKILNHAKQPDSIKAHICILFYEKNKEQKYIEALPGSYKTYFQGLCALNGWGDYKQINLPEAICLFQEAGNKGNLFAKFILMQIFNFLKLPHLTQIAQVIKNEINFLNVEEARYLKSEPVALMQLPFAAQDQKESKEGEEFTAEQCYLGLHDNSHIPNAEKAIPLLQKEIENAFFSGDEPEYKKSAENISKLKKLAVLTVDKTRSSLDENLKEYEELQKLLEGDGAIALALAKVYESRLSALSTEEGDKKLILENREIHCLCIAAKKAKPVTPEIYDKLEKYAQQKRDVLSSGCERAAMAHALLLAMNKIAEAKKDKSGNKGKPFHSLLQEVNSYPLDSEKYPTYQKLCNAIVLHEKFIGLCRVDDMPKGQKEILTDSIFGSFVQPDEIKREVNKFEERLKQLKGYLPLVLKKAEQEATANPADTCYPSPIGASFAAAAARPPAVNPNAAAAANSDEGYIWIAEVESVPRRTN